MCQALGGEQECARHSEDNKNVPGIGRRTRICQILGGEQEFATVKNPQKCALVFNAKNIVRKKCRGHDKIFPSDPSLLATVRTFIISYRITYDYEGPRC